eukprot:7986774-Pyramimonas_sp.AAC.1
MPPLSSQTTPREIPSPTLSKPPSTRRTETDTCPSQYRTLADPTDADLRHTCVRQHRVVMLTLRSHRVLPLSGLVGARADAGRAGGVQHIARPQRVRGKRALPSREARAALLLRVREGNIVFITRNHK